MHKTEAVSVCVCVCKKEYMWNSEESVVTMLKVMQNFV